jgi:pimeloyl-ACP methyl ester carboxylesterase
METKQISAGVLNIGYLEFGPKDGWPVIMCHGFPYDVQSYQSVASILADAGGHIFVPYQRGFGTTTFLFTETPRSGEQAALGSDLLAFMDALKIRKAIVGGYDWGGRAACIVSVLWPERVKALISGNSYNIQDVANSIVPAAPDVEASYWYQYYFHSERGRRGLTENRKSITELLWKMWSPTWNFDRTTFEASASAFNNVDFVDVVVHSYRHRYGLVEGDPDYESIETVLTRQQPITVPTITIDGDTDGVCKSTAAHAAKFIGPHQHRIFTGAGHNLPQERPEDWAQAVLDARQLQ